MRLAFEAGDVVDRGFKGIREDTETDGDGFKIELASTGRAGCQQKSCKTNGIKIDRGQLRLAKSSYYDGRQI